MNKGEKLIIDGDLSVSNLVNLHDLFSSKDLRLSRGMMDRIVPAWDAEKYLEPRLILERKGTILNTKLPK